jgi:hypothetical protein
MTRPAEIELIARVMLAAAELGTVWLIAPWLRLGGAASQLAAVVLVVATPAIAAAPQPLTRLILAVLLSTAVPAAALRAQGAPPGAHELRPTATTEELAAATWAIVAWLLPAAVVGIPVGIAVRRSLDWARQAEPHLPATLASTAGVVIAVAAAGGLAWGAYLLARPLAGAATAGMAALAAYAAAISGATWAWRFPQEDAADG